MSAVGQVERRVTAMTKAVFAAIVGVALAIASPIGYTQALPDFTPLVEKYSGAVVNISTTGKAVPEGFPGLENIPKDNPLYEFYRRFFERQMPRERDTRSLGSGFIISADGYIVTNNHVVRDAQKIVVRLNDRREYEAKLVGADERSDVALLKIEADRLPVVILADKDELRVGEWVLAIGSPFGFDYSVTAGIVSAKGRALPTENYVPFIQTDVAINPGNSGGPLFNLAGEVVGVNAQIYTRTGQYNGLSFAIPIDVAMNVVDQIRTRGRVSRGWLGVMIQDVTQELAESFGMDKPRGALVAKVLPDSPAEQAGFQVGDIVLTFDGTDVGRSSDLPPIVGRARVEGESKVEVLRNGERKTIEVRIAELPEDTRPLAEGGTPQTAEATKLGISVVDLTDEARKALEVPAGGVMVQETREGAASTAGIKTGDVILMFNKVKVESVEQFRVLVDDVEVGKPISVLVQRDKNPIFLALKPEE